MRTLTHLGLVASLVAGSLIAVHGQGAQPKSSPAKKTAAPKTSPKDKMPAPIRAAFDKAYPDAVVRGVSSEKEDGAVVWEVESTDNGKTRDLLYKPDGTVLLIEDSIGEADLPAPVKQAVASKYPKGTITHPERSTKGADVFYELVVDVAGKKHALELNADGTPHVEKKEAAPKKKD